MVELKSFKYVGDSAAGELGSKLDARKANIDASVASAKEESDAFGSPPLSTTPSSQSISTIVGGNLTATSDSGSQTLQNPASAASDKNETGKQSDEEASSNECQVAQFDIIGEEDESHEGADDAVTRINIIQREQQDQQQQQQQQPPAATPAPAQTPAMSANRRNFAKSPHAPLKSGRPRTPLMAHGVQLARAHLDNLSEDSFRPTQGANHFEIRWRNVNLRARRKSKLPNCIADHPLYKLFSKNSDLDGSQDKIYNSPPLMRHRLPQSPKLAGDAKLTSGSLSGNLAAAGDNESGSSSTDQYRTILNSISGSVFSGQLTAILGPSGVGKTTLLNSLTGRNTLDGTGRVSLLGNEASKRMSVVTVPQADVLPGKLTALEDLRFTSRLRNPERGFDHERNIGRIVRHLQMDKFLNTRIDKLSGGEARRLSIGRELLGSPDIMILDEPTSGLDANTCKKIIVALRDIVEHSDNILDKPMSIIITIHQPQQEVLNIFHRVYVMALGGCAIYEGPAPSLLPHLLEHSSLSKECQVEQLNENPAIVAIEVASGEYGLNVISELAQHHELQCMTNDDSFSFDSNGCSPFMTPRTVRGTPRRSPLAVSPRVGLTHSRSAGRISLDGASIGKPTPVLGRHAKLGSPLPALSSVTSLSSYDIDLPEPVSRLKVDKRLRRSVIMKGDFISHTLTLMSRCWLLTTRDMFLMVVRVVGFLMVAAGMVQIFAHALDPDEHICPMYQSEVDDVLSFMESTRERIQHVQKMLQQSSSTHTFFFHLGLCIFMVNAALAGLVFPLSMRMFLREYKNGWYSPASFITSNTLAELPIDMIGPILVVLIVYPLCNQPASDYHWREFGYVLVLIVSCIIGKSQSQIIGALLMNSVEMSVFISCVAVAPQAILSGIAVRVTQMTWPLQMASYTSWLRYCYEILFALRYGAGICPCDPATVNGYPTKPTLTAIPDHLDRMARGFLELNPGSVSAGAINSTSGLLIIEPDSAALQMMGPAMVDKYDTNLFVRYIRLVMDAGNLFAPKLSDLGDCTNYRSLYLIDMGIPDSVLTKWAAVLLAYLVFSRLLTYFVVKTVIKNAP